MRRRGGQRGDSHRFRSRRDDSARRKPDRYEFHSHSPRSDSASNGHYRRDRRCRSSPLSRMRRLESSHKERFPDSDGCYSRQGPQNRGRRQAADHRDRAIVNACRDKGLQSYPTVLSPISSRSSSRAASQSRSSGSYSYSYSSSRQSQDRADMRERAGTHTSRLATSTTEAKQAELLQPMTVTAGPNSPAIVTMRPHRSSGNTVGSGVSGSYRGRHYSIPPSPPDTATLAAMVADSGSEPASGTTPSRLQQLHQPCGSGPSATGGVSVTRALLINPGLLGDLPAAPQYQRCEGGWTTSQAACTCLAQQSHRDARERSVGQRRQPHQSSSQQQPQTQQPAVCRSNSSGRAAAGAASTSPPANASAAAPVTSVNTLQFKDADDYARWLTGKRPTLLEDQARGNRRGGSRSSTAHTSETVPDTKSSTVLASSRVAGSTAGGLAPQDAHPAITRDWREVCVDRHFFVMTGTPKHRAESLTLTATEDVSNGASATVPSPPPPQQQLATTCFSSDGEGTTVLEAITRSDTASEMATCFQRHFNYGNVHTKPPWYTCLSVDDNHEHPYYVDWLDSLNLPSVAEQLKLSRAKAEAKGLARSTPPSSST